MPFAKCSRRQGPKGENSWRTMVELLACSCFFLFHFSLWVDIAFSQSCAFQGQKALVQGQSFRGANPSHPMQT